MGLGRIGSETWQTTKVISRAMSNGVAAADDQIKLDEAEIAKAAKDRNVAQYIFGAPGILIGVAAGLIRGAGVFLEHNWESFKLTAGKLINASRDDDNQIPMKDDTRGLRRQFGVGFVGAVVGAVVGTVIGGANAIRKNPGLVVLVVWNLTIVGPLIVAGIRGIKETYKWASGKLRFSNEPKDDTHKKLKNLYASLTPMGDLPEGKKVEEAPKGPYSTYGVGKSIAKLFRKAITVNDQSLTERTLSNILVELDKSVKNTTRASVLSSGKSENEKSIEVTQGLSIEQKILFAVGITFDFYQERSDVVRSSGIRLVDLNPTTHEGKQVKAVAEFVMQYLQSGIPAAGAVNDASHSRKPVHGEVVRGDATTIVPEKLYSTSNGSAGFWSTRGNVTTHAPSSNATGAYSVPQTQEREEQGRNPHFFADASITRLVDNSGVNSLTPGNNGKQ